jgi:hypothetical protein
MRTDRDHEEISAEERAFESLSSHHTYPRNHSHLPEIQSESRLNATASISSKTPYFLSKWPHGGLTVFFWLTAWMTLAIGGLYW